MQVGGKTPGAYWHAVWFSAASFTLKSKKCHSVRPEMRSLDSATSTSARITSDW